MEELYLDIIAKLNDNPALAGLHKTIFRGQTTNPSLITSYPCILVDFPFTGYKDVSGRIQHATIVARLYICFETTALTGSNVTDAFVLKNKVYATLQGLKRDHPTVAPITSAYYPLTRGQERVENRYAGLYVYEMDFYTTLVDTGVYTKRNFVEAHTYDNPPTYPVPPGGRNIVHEITFVDKDGNVLE
jgi:hypothetical protein